MIRTIKSGCKNVKYQNKIKKHSCIGRKGENVSGMEKENKMNEYVRTKDGYIAKCIEEEEDGDYYVFDNYVDEHYGEKFFILYDNEFKNIVKHSKNLIDLIEVGDMVHTKDVLNEDWYWMFDEEMVKATIETIEQGIDLIDIVTKEQLEAVSYKVERKD